MAIKRNTPLHLPDDPKTHGAVLSRWAQELERRIAALELQLAQSHQQFESYKKLHP